MEAKKRNDYIDMLRGIAAISIIAIHTAFWSGESYTPAWFKSLTLLLDVPFFFFLSGWGSSMHKSDIIRVSKGLGKVWIKWIYFICVIALFCYVSNLVKHPIQGISGFGDLLNNFIFHVSIPGFQVVAGSIWFMPYYFIVHFVNSAVTSSFTLSKSPERLNVWYCVILAITFIWITSNQYFFGLDLYVVFYCFFWMLGYNRKKIDLSKPSAFIAAEIIAIGGFVLLCIGLKLPITDMQSAKFPPSVRYGFYSTILIFAALFFEPRIKKVSHLFTHIGKNAIFYFCAQGIGSSAIYYFLPFIDIQLWFVKWFVTFLISAAITITIAELLAKSYEIISRSFINLSTKMLPHSNNG